MERLEIVRETATPGKVSPETAKKRGGRKGKMVGANRSKRKHMEKVEGQER